jgi:tetratricopeptide (TPR) repeat protein
LLLLGVGLLFSAPAGAHPGLHHDIDRVTEAIAKEPKNADLYVQRAHYYRLLTKFEESLADLDKAKKLDADNLYIPLGRGLTLSGMGRYEEAEAELTRFIETGPASVPAYAERANIRARSGRLAEAIVDLTKAIELQREVGLYLARGALQEAIGALDAAAAGYRDGLTHLGGAVTIRLALIRVETQRKQYDAALKLIDEVVAAVPVKTDWYLRRAEVLKVAGRDQEAQRALELALSEANRVLKKRTTGIHLYARAKVYAALGQADEARQDLQAVLLKSPRFVQARELLEQLDGQGTRQED